jgi:hypothetical protein
VIRYTEDLADSVLNNDALRCDTARLATKLKGEFVDTIVELGYAIFLAKRGCAVMMEPTAPKAGPDLLVVKDESYYVEMRKVGLDEEHRTVDAAPGDVFTRLCSTPSQYSLTPTWRLQVGSQCGPLRSTSQHASPITTRKAISKSIQVNFRTDGHARAQLLQVPLIWMEAYPHWQSLYYFHVVASGILGRKQA